MRLGGREEENQDPPSPSFGATSEGGGGFGGPEPLRRYKHGFTEGFLSATRYKSRYKPERGGTGVVRAWRWERAAKLYGFCIALHLFASPQFMS